MDLSPVYQPLIAALWYLLPLAFVAGLIKLPWFKGKFGEFLVNLSARWFLDKSRYHIIKNVILPTEDGTTQIDHVLVCCDSSVPGSALMPRKGVRLAMVASQLSISSRLAW